MICQCGAAIPAGARFCAACGRAAPGDQLDVGITAQVTRESPVAAAGALAGRTPHGSRGAASGWLSSDDAISHGSMTPGTLLDGRYRIIGLLGRGGMGEVYRADDLRLGQPVALKFLPEALRHDAVRLAQFHNEVRTARQVSHPNVCRVYDIGEADGLLYLSMEFVDGEDLASSLRRIGRFPEDRATELARQLCAGLAAAHQSGVIHRDLKPANIMLDGAGRVRIMDFGLAAVGQVDDVRAGTPAYMAPEQLLGREVSVRSDIFALGLVLYELFTGRRAFTATTIGELVNQHESRAFAAPSSSVANLDPAIDRAILRCLESDPARRPASALGVAAALPGGDPLAAALAAGETPSPEMVAAAGEGVGVRPRTAWLVLAAIVIGVAASFVMSIRTSALEQLRPQFPAEVLAQKARDALTQLGYQERPRDDAYGFSWDMPLAQQLREDGGPSAVRPFTAGPSPLHFWYRQSHETMTAVMFHTDLLTPGIVQADDPPPTMSGMAQVTLDHRGRLTFFEAIPAQRQAPLAAASPAVNWTGLLALAGLDATSLTSAEPQWTFLAASDARAAWTGTWPGSGRTLRAEAAALHGRPTAFMLVDPATTPARMPEPSSSATTVSAALLMLLTVGILTVATLLAWTNLTHGRGDQRAALRLGIWIALILLALWACQAHMTASVELMAVFLLAVCTAVFYGVVHWVLYMALEPFVRRHWPLVLVSLTNLLSGRARDPVVGRDVLFGVALGVAWAVGLRAVDGLTSQEAFVIFPGASELLEGVRPSLGVILQEAPYAIRNTLLYFFLLFVLRVVLRREWMAALAFAAMFGVLSALMEEQPMVEGAVGFVYFGAAALAILRWGLLSLAVASFAMALLLDVPATLDTSVWYFGNMMLPVAIVVAIAAWGAYTVTAGRLVRTTSFE